jgi:hypothetical protein
VDQVFTGGYIEAAVSFTGPDESTHRLTMDVPMEMVGRESVVATWNLWMEGEDGEVRKPSQNKDGTRELAKGGQSASIDISGFVLC